MNLHALKRKETNSSSSAAEPHSITRVTHEPLIEALDLPQFTHYDSSDQLKKKHKVIANKTLYSQEGDMPKESTREMEPPLTTILVPLGGQSSMLGSTKKESRSWLMLDLCNGKPLLLTTLQMANYLNLTLEAPLQP